MIRWQCSFRCSSYAPRSQGDKHSCAVLSFFECGNSLDQAMVVKFYAIRRNSMWSAAVSIEGFFWEWRRHCHRTRVAKIVVNSIRNDGCRSVFKMMILTTHQGFCTLNPSTDNIFICRSRSDHVGMHYTILRYRCSMREWRKISS